MDWTYEALLQHEFSGAELTRGRFAVVAEPLPPLTLDFHAPDRHGTRYVIGWGLAVTYNVLLGHNHQDLYLMCECGGDLDNAVQLFCTVCDRTHRPLDRATLFLAQMEPTGRVKWLQDSLVCGGLNELQATLQAPVLDSLLTHVDSEIRRVVLPNLPQRHE